MLPSPRRLALALALVATIAPLCTLAGQQAAGTRATPEGKRLWVTLSGGASFSKFTGATADTAALATRIGYTASASLGYELSPRFGLALEAGLVQMGAKQLEVSRDPGLGYNITYLELGLSAEFNLAPGAVIQPVLHAGPTLGFEVDCMQPILYNQTSILQSNCLDEPERESTEFGGQIGLALRWKFLVLDGRYERAFASVLPGEDLVNSGFMVALGVRF
jgi:hypothetical protein